MRSRAPKIFWMLPLLVAVLVALIGWGADYKVRQAIQKTLKADLQTVLEANVTALEIWMRNQERMAMGIVSEPRVHEAALALAGKFGSGIVDPLDVEESSELVNFERVMEERMFSSGYLSAQLIGTNRLVIGASGRGRLRLGTLVAEVHEAKFDQLFASGNPVIITPFKPFFRLPPRTSSGSKKGRPPTRLPGQRDSERKGPPDRPGDAQTKGGTRPGQNAPLRRDTSFMQVAAPVKSPGKRPVAALTFMLRPEEEFTGVLSVARPGMTGETFAFDQTGLMISQSRFDQQLKELGLLENAPDISSALTLELRDPGGDMTKGFRPSPGDPRPLIWMIDEAVDDRSGVEVEPFRDYRGVLVVGAWRWLPEYGFGVGTKIDAREAYQPLRVLRGIFSVLVLLLAVSALGMLVFSYSNLVWRRKFDEAQLEAKQLGQYTLEEKIGEGGMGAVYKARHALLRRETAIKLLLPDKADDYSVKQFEREVQLTCQLTHPNTIQVYDYGHTPEGIFYYAMELLRGLNLRDLISEHGAQGEARAIHILIHVCESLKEAHAAGLIHRDIKPGNIFLCERGGMPDTVKVLDFGLVKHVRERDPKKLEKTDTQPLVGTPQYLPPETIQNPSHGDARGDIYAVGAVGYYLVTGRHVFDGDTAFAIFERHVREAPVPPSQIATTPISAEFEKVILHCLAKSPEARPQSMDELLAELHACPQADAWTLERRRAWWMEHAKATAPAIRDAARKLPAGVDRTLKIDLGERRG